ncbi:alpha/beta hydrolase [Aliidiomarina shirensis]|uniref:Alpha/beta hydrolase n=1 Tax=Aliidiomarina shirensis TaxID=1048642 RepID=A0A432WXU6_9GAMM|nr:alpha/beta hydrolase [Aliidiomarina shirensis]RUO38620.1 alpha/beta hydrolase [Aliidiomarina shirensis]
MKIFITLVMLTLSITKCIAQTENEIFEFEFEGYTLNGVLNLPDEPEPKGIVLIVHGSGETNAVEQNWYSDVRQTILSAGYGTYMWDKMGCGNSEGTFNYNQSVENSALEVIAAINELKRKMIPGSDKIGLWGISRAGWINPLVINNYSDIEFWISVSGVDGKENFKYLLEQNLRISGHPEDYVELIVNEWVEGMRITHLGESFEAYQNATSNLGKNQFWLRFTDGGITEEGYNLYQATFMEEEFEESMGLQVYIPNFDKILSNIEIPVLALFGEQDMNVDWKETKLLYQSALKNSADLTIESFPNCNHNLFQSDTGGFFEFQDRSLTRTRCDGFLDAMADWLDKR